MEPVPQNTVHRAATTRPAAAPQPVVCVTQARVQLQSALRVSSPRDPAEREADATAARIMSASSPDVTSAPTRGLGAPSLARFADSMRILRAHGAAPSIARKGEGDGAVGPGVAAEIASAKSGGSPLPTSVQRFMEPRFGADFGKVRVHTGDRAAKLNRSVNAQAFTHGAHIFFGQDRFKPDTHEGKELIAHELTHTIQQGEAVQRRADVTVNERSSGADVQRLFGIKLPGIDTVLDYFANLANAIPGFRMFTIVLGVNPINMSSVDRSAANILRAVVEFLPGGNLITRALDSYGIFNRAGAWIEGQLASLGLSGASIKKSLMDFLGTISPASFLDPGGIWDNAKRIFSEPIDRIISLVKRVGAWFIELIKDTILRPLGALAAQTPGWDLLCAVLGKNPVTGDAVPRTAETVIGGFMKLIGQEEIWENIKKGNAIARAFAWFQTALDGLMGFVREIPGLFLATLKSLGIADLVVLPMAFVKVAKAFGSFFGRFVSWAGGTIWDLLEIVFSVVAPSVITYIKKAAGAFKTILKNPIAFVRSLVAAGKLGLSQFASNFLKHLKAALISWLTGALSGAGIYIPQALSLIEFGKLALSVLGVSWPQIRAKIVKVLPGGETTMKVLETGFDIVVALVTGGPAAAWEIIKDKLAGLRDTIMQGIISFVTESVVKAAIARLVGFLVPGAGFITAILTIVDTVTVFVQKLKDIAQVVASFIDSIAAIANGQIGAAANRVESAMAGALNVVVAFLAKFAGLGKVTDKIVGVVKKLQGTVDKGLDTAIAWIVKQAKAVLAKLLGKGKKDKDKKDGPKLEEIRVPVPMRGAQHTLSIGGASGTKVLMASAVGPLASKVDSAVAALRKSKNPDASRLGVMGQIRAAAVLVEAAEARAETGDRASMDLLRTRLEALGSAIAAYATRFDATDLDSLTGTDDVQLAVEVAQRAADEKRLAPMVETKILMQIERVMGPGWSKYVSGIMGKVWTLTEASLVRAYGPEKAARLTTGPRSVLLGKGLYDPARDLIFVNVNRSITEISASIVHEGTHSLQTKFGTTIDRYQKEFEAFTVQRVFLTRLERSKWDKVPKEYRELMNASSDAALHHFVNVKYPEFKQNKELTQAEASVLFKTLVRTQFGTP
ncbi:MAG: DUF4157 domain-containing protein [Byssovorax sp.]